MPAFIPSEALGTPSSTGIEPCSTTAVVGTAAALAASGAGAAESFAFKTGDADGGATDCRHGQAPDERRRNGADQARPQAIEARR